MQKQKIICIVGPTGSGKSATAVRLAKEFNGEIISADSMQIYKDMNIGTAKVTEEEMQGIPHYLINVVDPTQNFSVSDWKDMAETCIDEISKRGKVPIIVGGTGLYVNALINNFKFFSVDEETRNNYIAYYNDFLDKNGVDVLYNELEKKNKKLALSVDKNKTRAIINYLAMIDAGATYLTQKDNEKKYDYLLIGLDVERKIIYDRIDKRVDEMMKAGLMAEIEMLKEKYGFNKEMQSASAIGYREFWDYFDGNISEEDAINLVKQHSRNYAKRQFTYMKKMSNINWIQYGNFELISNKVRSFLKGEE